MSTRRRAFETFIEGYLDDLATLGYDELVDEQPPPYAALACGAAGIAYTLWRAGRALAAPALGEAARRWIDAAEMRREHAGSFAGPERVDASLYFGPAGLDLIAALEIGTADSAALSRFARAARAAVAAAESADLLLGTAGLLVGASILAAHVPGRDAAILEAELLDAVVSAEPAGPSMGHGETGALFAALGVYERRSKPPPAALVGRVEALPDEVPPPPAGSFCR